MTQPTVKKRRTTTSWTRAPFATEVAEPLAPAADDLGERQGIDEAEGAVDAPTRGPLSKGRRMATRLSGEVSRTLQHASSKLMAPAPDGLEALLPSVDLPELERDAPLDSLARRLDREGDLWRGLALRALGRASWADRFTQATAVVGAAGCVALATVAALGGLFAAATAAERSLLLLTGCATLVAASALVAVTAAGVRRAQHAVAREALRRADLAELRLHRVAVALAAEQRGPEAAASALGRLEVDVGDC